MVAATQHSENLHEVNVHTITEYCLICEEPDFELASKRPDGTANQITTINWIDMATKRCKLHKTLKTF